MQSDASGVKLNGYRQVIGLAAAVLLSACGASGGATYHGRIESPRARAELIGEFASLRSGWERMGTLHARCTLKPGFRALSGERLSDVDCGFERLTWAMRERAAEVGGEALITRRCYANKSARGQRIAMHCEADLARRTEESTGMIKVAAESRPAPSAREVSRIDEPSAESAWLVSVEFVPTKPIFLRRARHYASVSELSTMPVSHVVVGDVLTRCDCECSVDVLRHGLRVAAGRLGASDIVNVRCFQTDDGRSCAATAAVAEVDPTLNANAR